MKFAIEGGSAPNVIFRAEVDGDGDLMLYANDHKLLFITRDSGCLARMEVPADQRAALTGFLFNEEGRIKMIG